MTTTQPIIVLLLITLAATGCSRGVPVQAAKAKRGEIREFVDEQAKTRLPQTFEVTMPFPARIKPIALAEGERVTAGQIVAQVITEDLANEVAEARAAVQRLEASLAENNDTSVEEGARQQALKFVDSMTSTVAAAEERKKSGQKRLDFAEAFLGRVRKLFDSQTGAQTQEGLERAELQHVEAQVDYRQDVLVTESIKALEAATLLMPQMVADYISRKSLTGAVLDKQKAEAEARLKQAITRQQRGDMHSPVDGVVLERLETDEQFVSAGTTLLRIGNLQQLEVEAEILSQEVVRIHVGDEVDIYGPAIQGQPSQRVQGTVSRIYPAGFTKLSSLGVEQQRVKVVVAFEPDVLPVLLEKGLGVEYRVRVRIFTATKTDAMLVPRSAIFRSPDGGWQLFAIQNGATQLRPVEIGLMNDELVEITSGLQADDSVILAPENSLLDGARVNPTVRQ